MSSRPKPDNLDSSWSRCGDFPLKLGHHPVEIQGQTFIRVRYDFRPQEARDAARYQARGGWVLLDPEHHWVIKAYEVGLHSINGEASATCDNIYEFEASRTALVTSKVNLLIHLNTGGDLNTTINTIYRMQPKPDTPEDDFKLSAFGLPEPSRTRSSPLTPHTLQPGSDDTYLYSVAVGFGLIIGGGLLRRLSLSGKRVQEKRLGSESPAVGDDSR